MTLHDLPSLGWDQRLDAAFSALPVDGDTLPARVTRVDRGACEFSTKVLNAQNAGAVGVVIANNNTSNPTEVFGPAAGVDAPSVTIPSVMVSYSSGTTLKTLVGSAATVVKVDATMALPISRVPPSAADATTRRVSTELKSTLRFLPNFSWRWRLMFSITTMPLSTSMPAASERPPRLMRFSFTLPK